MPNYMLFFRQLGSDEDPVLQGLLRVVSEKRLDRCVGVKYNKDPQKEVQGHYQDGVISELYDALLWVDRTTALVPLDITLEWRAGQLDPKLYKE